MLVKDYFTKDEIIETMRKAEDYSVDDFDELFNSMFNRNSYIIGTYAAAKALETYKNDEELDGYKTKLDGALGAMVLVERYELDHFGRILTPLYSEPEKLANRVEYIRGKRLFNEALSKADIDLFEAPTEEILKNFIVAATELQGEDKND